MRTGICFIGRERDLSKGEDRWTSFRPTVGFALLRDPDKYAEDGSFVPFFDTVYIISQQEEPERQLCPQIQGDIESEAAQLFARPPVLKTLEVKFEDAFDVNGCFKVLYGLLERIALESPGTIYYGINTGTHAMLLAAYLIGHFQLLDVTLLQLTPGRPRTREGNTVDVTAAELQLTWTAYSEISKTIHAVSKARDEHFSMLRSMNKRNRLEAEEWVDIASRTTDHLLILGESGAGKTQLAEEIHKRCQQLSGRSGPFKEANCACLDPHMAESYLFGHVEGAYTGAIGPRRGCLLEADGGTLFLDELGTLPADTQAKLLRVLESGRDEQGRRKPYTFTPMGSSSEVTSDFRLICATNIDLRSAVQRGEFREDLYARIRRWEYRVPSLRERLEDIGDEVNFFLRQWKSDMEHVGHTLHIQFPKIARTPYLEYAKSAEAVWTGNYRDLRDSVIRMATRAWVKDPIGGCITLEIVEGEINELRRRWHRGGQGSEVLMGKLLDTLEAEGSDAPLALRLEALLQRVALDRSKGSKAAAGRLVYGDHQKNPSSIFSNAAGRVARDLAQWENTDETAPE